MSKMGTSMKSHTPKIPLKTAFWLGFNKTLYLVLAVSHMHRMLSLFPQVEVSNLNRLAYLDDVLIH